MVGVKSLVETPRSVKDFGSLNVSPPSTLLEKNILLPAKVLSSQTIYTLSPNAAISGASESSKGPEDLLIFIGIVKVRPPSSLLAKNTSSVSAVGPCSVHVTNILSPNDATLGTNEGSSLLLTLTGGPKTVASLFKFEP